MSIHYLQNAVDNLGLQKMKAKVDEVKYVEARLAGKSGTQAALEARPGIKVSSAKVAASRLSKSPTVQALLQKAFKKYDISIKRAVAVVNDALEATKLTRDGDEVPDYPTRLKAADMVFSLSGAKHDKAPAQQAPFVQNNTAIVAAMEQKDMVKLQDAIFEAKADQ